MRKLSIVIAAMLFSLSIIGTVFADNYGSAGCGLGSVIFGDKPGGIQVIAATTNGSTYSQLFGITSGTSNCDKQPTSFSNKKLNEFVVANVDNLAKDIAMGHGESLETVAELLGIPTAQRTQVYAKLQSNFPNIFTSEKVEASDVIDGIIMIVNG